MKNILFIVFTILILFYSCKKEEDEIEPPRDMQQQSLIDDQNIQDFLSSHFYNYDDFLDLNYNSELIFDTISGENATKIALIDQVKKEIIRVQTSEGNYVDHNLYYLVAREGTEIKPAISDSIYLSYQGNLLNGFTFDSSKAPIWFDLTNLVRGFREGASKFKSGDFILNEDNTVDFYGYGQGALFFPSGLGYFNQSVGSVPSYSPLIFKVKIYLVNQTDHDGDGIPSSDEYDNDGDGRPDDTDQDGIPDYLDTD